MTAHRHLLFGFCVETDYLFRTPMTAAPHDKAPDLFFRLTLLASQRVLLPGACLYQSSGKNRFDESSVQLYALPSGVVMRFPRIADFWLTPGEIHCELCDPTLEYMVDVLLLGHVMACYLEQQGLLAMHAGALVVGEQAVLLAGDKGAGKSSMVSSMVAAGFPLMADDIAPVEENGGEVLCRSAFPQVKLSPEQLERFATGNNRAYPRFHPGFTKLSVPAADLGAFDPGPRQVGAIYLLERGSRECPTIETVPPARAVVELARQTFLGDILESSPLQRHRFDHLVRVARAVPVRRLCYPDGFHHLDDVHEAIVRDLASPSRRYLNDTRCCANDSGKV